MISPRQTPGKDNSSTPVDRGGRGTKLILKAANDNRAPLSKRVSLFLFYGAPIVVGCGFLAIWALS